MWGVIWVITVLVSTCCAYNPFTTLSRESVLAPFMEKRALKVIAGLQNFDESLVTNVARAANLGGASHVDIACDDDLVRIAKSVCGDVAVCTQPLTLP